MSAEIQSTRIFIAYSSKDLAYKEEIRKHLKPLVRTGKVSVWDNYDIEGGADWDADIREKLEASDIILLLLSPDALASDYFYEVEAHIALRRHKAGEALAVGVWLRPCTLKHTPFGDLTRYELLPKKGLPVTEWSNADAAYLTIIEEIDHLVEKFEGLRAEQGLRLERQHEYADLTDQADALVKKKKWTEAKALLDKALKMWEEGFEPRRELFEKLQKQCAKEMEAIEKAEGIKREREVAEARAHEEAERKRREADEAARRKREQEEAERKRRESAQAAREKSLREQADHDTWEIAEETDTEVAYKKYLNKYSAGLHAAQAKKKIAAHEQAREEEARKKREREAAEARARENAERLKREEEQADKSAWELAQKTGTSEAYAKYLKAYPEGRYAVQAYYLQQELLENEATAQKQREEEVRKKRERDAIEARAREEAEKRQREEAERKRREDEEAPPAAPKRKRDYYEVLGVPRIAASDVIEKAYTEKKRAVSPGSEADLELQEAYKMLSDADLRRKYDRYGHAGVEGNPSTNEMSMDDILRRFGFDIDQTGE